MSDVIPKDRYLSQYNEAFVELTIAYLIYDECRRRSGTDEQSPKTTSADSFLLHFGRDCSMVGFVA